LELQNYVLQLAPNYATLGGQTTAGGAVAAQVLDGRGHADGMLEETGAGVAGIVASGARAPALAVVLVGDDPASQVYVRNKVAACARTGVTSMERRLKADAPQGEVVGLIDSLNADPGVDGVLLQLPLPGHLDAKAALLRIDPSKDVDGLHPYSMGLLLQGAPGLRPCTPGAVMHMLRAHGVAMKGARAVVIGRSEIGGKPRALMLLEEHATVTIAHSRTQDLPALCRQADVLVAAVGRPGLVEGSWIKPGAVVIDVGINEVTDAALATGIMAQEPKKLETLKAKGRVLYGDVRFGEAVQVASAITPVPGGVGPLTIAGLMGNTLLAYRRRAAKG
jgi:methylenetetrahydrofolate dehydrogenase (NADP+)/methenyltetrahydrofolate cyclohydrolase